MARKNPGVRFGRPPATAASKMPKSGRGVAPSDNFSPGIPASGFKCGGSVGYRTMPQYHDDAKLTRGGGKYDPRK